MEVLDQWLRNFPGRPTWRDVANVLRRIGLQKLANDIEMVYETGKNNINASIYCMYFFFSYLGALSKVLVEKLTSL